jgi:hypothetical protein
MRARLVLAVALAPCVGCAPARNDTAAPDPRMPAVAATSAQPAGARSTVPDPVEAAVSYVSSTDTLMGHSTIGRAEIFRELVVPEAVDGQTQAFEQLAEDMAATLGLDVVRLSWVEAPLTATLVEQAADSATVDVWTVSVLGAPDTGPPQQVWRTVRVVLGLVDGAWLVADANADSGPTPASNELALQSGFDEFAEVAGWPAVVPGVEL